MEKESVARIITETEADRIAEIIRDAQMTINNEIRFRAHQSFDNLTRFELNNLFVSLSEKEEPYSNEIFEPFIAKGYTLTPLSVFEPFADYSVYLLSWK